MNATIISTTVIGVTKVHYCDVSYNWEVYLCIAEVVEVGSKRTVKSVEVRNSEKLKRSEKAHFRRVIINFFNT